MKVSAILLTMMLTTIQAELSNQIPNSNNIRNLLSGRRLEQGINYNAEGVVEVEDELMNYSLKLFKCEAAESLSVNDNGVLNYGVAIVRACPHKSCSSSTQGGCKSGYADFAVPLTDFVEAYFQDQSNNYDDQMNVAQFSQCAAYKQDNQGVQYYVGPTCTSDGKNVRMALFTDEYCQSPVENNKNVDVSAIPYYKGGLLSNQCLFCGENGNNGVYELKEMCATLYEDAKLKCEAWDINHYYWDAITEVYRFGKDTTGCKRIAWMDKSPPPFSEWGTIIVLSFLIIGSIAGGVYYTIWWKKQKANLEKIDDDEDDDEHDYHEQGDEEVSPPAQGVMA